MAREDDALIIGIGAKFEELSRQAFAPSRSGRQIIADAVGGEPVEHIVGDVELEGRGARVNVLVLTEHYAAQVVAEWMPSTLTQEGDTKPIRIRVAPRKALTLLDLDVPGWPQRWPYDGSDFPAGTSMTVHYGTGEPIVVPGDRPGAVAIHRTLVADLARA